MDEKDLFAKLIIIKEEIKNILLVQKNNLEELLNLFIKIKNDLSNLKKYSAIPGSWVAHKSHEAKKVIYSLYKTKTTWLEIIKGIQEKFIFVSKNNYTNNNLVAKNLSLPFEYLHLSNFSFFSMKKLIVKFIA